ncbi:MAG: hypothetical protein JWN15_421, partial [Firmicutes bacterium]|nr:hypothetical protein [Bacillota bacterium]
EQMGRWALSRRLFSERHASDGPGGNQASFTDVHTSVRDCNQKEMFVP